MFDLNNISVYILNWKKVTQNSIKLYQNINTIIKDVTIINCDDTYKMDDTIKHIQLDDSCYFSKQYDASIKDIKEGKILCIIVGDNISNNDFEKIFTSSIDTFNKYNVGVYSPNDKRSVYTERKENFAGDLYNVDNTDCGFWFIHPTLVKKLRNIKYSITKYGWGIDIITIKEARKQGMLVLRDYSIETDQLDHICNYNRQDAAKEIHVIEFLYNLDYKNKIC